MTKGRNRSCRTKRGGGNQTRGSGGDNREKRGGKGHADCKQGGSNQRTSHSEGHLKHKQCRDRRGKEGEGVARQVEGGAGR